MLMQMLSEIFRDCSADVLRILQLLEEAVCAALEYWIAVYAGVYTAALP